MRVFGGALAAAVLALGVTALASDQYIGKLTTADGGSTCTMVWADGGTSDALLSPGAEYTVQSEDIGWRYRFCATSSCTATSNDYPVPVNFGLPILAPRDKPYFCIISNPTAAGTCKVYASDPRLFQIVR